MLKKFFLTLVFAVLCNIAFAASDELLRLGFEVRADYQRTFLNNEASKEDSGFRLPNINFRLDGTISDHFTYSYRQRLNKFNSFENFLEGTDWLWLRYQHEFFSVTAGKNAIAIGGWECDRAPIDTYFMSDFWENFSGFVFALNLGFKLSDRDEIFAQAAQSPHDTHEDDLYAYSAIWYGHHNWFHPIYSLSWVEYVPGRFYGNLCLGNKFDFGKFYVEFDFHNRFRGGQRFLFDDWEVVGELVYHPIGKLDVVVKSSYESHSDGLEHTLYVTPGKQATIIGGGFQFYPLPKGNKNIRVHAMVGHHTSNANPMMETDFTSSTCYNVGLTWKMDFLNLKRKNRS